ncbi:S-adenosyl-L-methionine-dependent methyltransferase [Pilobolus umbonatus]|nr:S-adenosyl-L-methionine-dependent methyltransferase [Pilobolus umbonatus]
MEDFPSNDDIIRGTNDDATISRLSAVTQGYFKDPFVHLFVRRPIRRSPIINRGTFIRSHALDSIVQQFLSMSASHKQIVSLGAGFDTRYFLIKAGLLGKEEKLISRLKCYFEVDFPEITMKKAMCIKRKTELHQLLGDSDQVKIEKGGMILKGPSYCLLGGDLRNWPEVVKSLMESGLDTSIPTLFISECVFIYLNPNHSADILKWITNHMRNTMFVLYEQIKPNDAFGKMMIQNLKSRNIDLKGLESYPDLVDQENRFKELGWQYSKSVDINTIHDRYMDKNEFKRMAKLEILDELEEWRLLSAHYCITWAYKSMDHQDLFTQINLNKIG